MTTFVNLLLNSATLGGTYCLIALCWTLIFRATNVANFGAGAILTFGAYVFFSAVQTMGIVPAIFVGAAATAVLSALWHVCVLRHLSSQEFFATAIVTFGLANILASAIEAGWGTVSESVPVSTLTLLYHSASGITITVEQVVDIGTAFAVVFAVAVLMRRTRIGISMEAAAENPALAGQAGINVGRMAVMAWALAGAIAAVVGALYVSGVSQIDNSISSLGIAGLVPAFVGGLDSIGGTLAGGMIVGTVITFAAQIFGGNVSDAVLYGTLIVFVVIRPSGLFGTARVARV